MLSSNQLMSVKKIECVMKWIEMLVKMIVVVMIHEKTTVLVVTWIAMCSMMMSFVKMDKMIVMTVKKFVADLKLGNVVEREDEMIVMIELYAVLGCVVSVENLQLMYCVL